MGDRGQDEEELERISQVPWKILPPLHSGSICPRGNMSHTPRLPVLTKAGVPVFLTKKIEVYITRKILFIGMPLNRNQLLHWVLH